MRSCEAIYGPTQADAIEELVVVSTGERCPCRRGSPCPLLDGEGCSPLALQTPEPPPADGDQGAANKALALALVSAQQGR